MAEETPKPEDPKYIYSIMEDGVETPLIHGTNLDKVIEALQNKVRPAHYSMVTLLRSFNNDCLVGRSTWLALPDSITEHIHCARSACNKPLAFCVHTQSRARYCASCARKINEEDRERIVVIPIRIENLLDDVNGKPPGFKPI